MHATEIQVQFFSSITLVLRKSYQPIPKLHLYKFTK